MTLTLTLTTDPKIYILLTGDMYFVIQAIPSQLVLSLVYVPESDLSQTQTNLLRSLLGTLHTLALISWTLVLTLPMTSTCLTLTLTII